MPTMKNPGQVDHVRRGMCAALAGLLVAWRDNIFVEEANSAANYGGKLIAREFLTPNSDIQALNQQYADLCNHIFLSSKTEITEFICPDKWKDPHGRIVPPDWALPNGTSTYGHEAAVFTSTFSFLTASMGFSKEVGDKFPDPTDGNSKISLGSGSSNEFSELILGKPASPRFAGTGFSLHYAIGRSEKKLKRKQYGIELGPYNAHTIRDADGKTLFEPKSTHGFQTDDYLLVTRIPGFQEGSTITIFSGLHGPGTRAAELLFSGKLGPRTLERLAGAIGLENRKVPHFQAVFRASGFRSDLADDTTDSDVATQIELVDSRECPPVRLGD